jgi:hypothetical protein
MGRGAARSGPAGRWRNLLAAPGAVNEYWRPAVAHDFNHMKRRQNRRSTPGPQGGVRSRDAQRGTPSPESAVLQVLRRAGRPMRLEEITAELGPAAGADAEARLATLVKHGEVVLNRRGQY